MFTFKKKELDTWNGVTSDLERQGIKYNEAYEKVQRQKQMNRWYQSDLLSTRRSRAIYMGSCHICGDHGSGVICNNLHVCLTCFFSSKQRIFYFTDEVDGIRYWELWIGEKGIIFLNGCQVTVFPSGEVLGYTYGWDKREAFCFNGYLKYL